MKRYVRATNTDGKIQRIYGMSVDRPKAISSLKEDAETLQIHILKCVVYGDTTHNFDYWIEIEIAQYLHMANSITLKPKATKGKPDMYLRTIFGYIGDSEVDANVDLERFRMRIQQGKIDYPMYDITPDMVHTLYETYMLVIETILPILTSKNNMGKEDFYPILHKILDPCRNPVWNT